jgi:toxin HigB-1
MIVSYRDRKTERFANGEQVKQFSGFAQQAERRLDRLDAATSLKDLAALPGNRLEALKGDRHGQYSIRINDQWRMCFEWPKGSPGPINVQITITTNGGRLWHAPLFTPASTLPKS